MDEQDQHQPRQRVGSGGEGVFVTLISAAIFLYVGFRFGISVSDSDALIYRLASHAFIWMARIVGCGLVVVAVINFFGVPAGRLLDAGLTVLAAAICLITGAVWIYYNDVNGFLVLLFGLINASAARSAVARAK